MSFTDCLNALKRKDTPNQGSSLPIEPQNTEKEKTFTYSPNSGLEDKPCEKPYEHEGGIELNFNFWTNNKCIIDRHIVELLVSLIKRQQNEILRNKASWIDKLEHIILVSARGVDPRELGIQLKSLSFLSQCSSMPVNHVAQMDTAYNSQPIRWQYMDAEDVNSLLLWPERPLIEGANLLKLSTFQLFEEYNSIFMAEHSDWQDDLYFNIDVSITKEKISTLITQKLENAEGSLKEQYLSLHSNFSSNNIMGKFKRYRTGDSGTFVLTRATVQSSSHILYLLWNKWDLEILDEITTNGEDDEERFLSFTKRLLKSNQSMNVKDLYIEVKKAILRPKTEITLTETTSVENICVDAIPTAITSVNEQVGHDIILTELRESYLEIKLNSHLACRLDNLILSKDMMELMGFPLHTFQESGFLDTNSIAWSRNATAGSHVRFEVEDGEEVEESQNSSEVTLVNSITYEALNICALDCEMCATEAGLELTRLTVICPEKGVVYDSLVKPKRPIIEYHTSFSGITKEMLENVTTTIDDVHIVLRQLITKNTIIVGHSLDSDLKTLHIVHHRVIDTAALYPNSKGLPFKHSLKNLAREHLSKNIQEGEGTAGHDSVQDAAIALQLVFLKVINGPDFGMNKPWQDSTISRYNLFEHLQNEIKDSTSYFNVFSCPSYFERQNWERHALGYRAESQSDFTAQLYKEFVVQETKINLCGPSTRETNVSTSCNALKDLTLSNVHSPTFSWIDLPIGIEVTPSDLEILELDGQPPFKKRRVQLDDDNDDDNYDQSSDNDNDDVNHEPDVTTLQVIDKSLADIYAAAPVNSVILVVTQSDLVELKKLAANKMRARWDANAVKKKLALADCSRVTWDGVVDEKKLLFSAAHAICGTLFLRYK